ncbi:hypothetical protein [Corynebacterium haemomassiliense]|uniref:Uncharacterized protein n=1 Tax=Corynebacterium haemomassiliense TaxID=2754726 RepID=A0A7W2I4R2_9CORY|nr:hypothetical protein [Corynebacterium haemomassiliense]MBA5245372.1 hypothetical protein [Corynebacterium haemomassiliense]
MDFLTYMVNEHLDGEEENYRVNVVPDDPVRIARQSDWGQGQLAKVSTRCCCKLQAESRDDPVFIL